MRKRTGRLIVEGSEYGDPRKAALKEPIDDAYYAAPRLYGRNIVNTSRGPIRRNAAAMASSAGTVGLSGQSIQSMSQSPLFYDYRWSTPDKYYFPRNRVVANSIWREIYKRDPTVATATDMYSDLPWSDFDITGIEDASIRHVYEDMFSKLNLVPKLPLFTREFLVTGELVLHNLFSASEGFWVRTIAHDVDYIRVEGLGLAAEQPLLWLRPTPEAKKLVHTTDPRMIKLQKALPRELVNAIRADKEVPLDPLNTTYIPRTNFMKDLRGTSLYTRLYRIVMYEDFIVNASLAVAQRNAAPLRLFKLGDPNTGWLPDEDDEAAFAEMLSIAESDPLAAIVMHHNVTCELVGVSDRVLLISKEWEFIERVKLLALGVAKSFLIGETSFAAAVAGMQMLLQRLATLRNMFENAWLNRKVCRPVAQINEFYKRPESELVHRLRIKQPDELDLLVPKLKWKKNLDPAQDVAILNIWRDLKERGLISDRTYASGAGVDIEVERKNIVEERKYREQHPEIYGAPQMQPGMPGAPRAPGAPGARPPAGTPGVAPGVPVAPMPASKHKRYGAANPYLSEEFQVFVDDLEANLDDLADKENKIDVQDALDAVRQVEQERLSAAEQYLPYAGNDLLSGTGVGDA